MAYKMKGSPLKQSPYKQDLSMDSTLGDVSNKIKSKVKTGIKNLGNTTIKDGLKAAGKGVLNIASGNLMSMASNIYNKVRAKDASTGATGGLKSLSTKKTVSNMMPFTLAHETKHRTLKKGTKPVNKIKAQGIEKNVKVNKKSKGGNKGGSFLPKDENDSRYDDIKNSSAPLKHIKKKNGQSKSARHLGLHAKHGTNGVNSSDHDNFPSVGDRVGKVVNKVKDAAIKVKDAVVDNAKDLATTVKNKKKN